MADDRIKQAENELLDSLNQPQSYENDGEKITQLDPEKRLNVINRVKRARGNPWKKLGFMKISTQGPEK